MPCHANNTSRHEAQEGFSRCKKSSVRSTVAERQTKPLTAADCNVGARLAGWTQQSESQQVRSDGNQWLRHQPAVTST